MVITVSQVTLQFHPLIYTNLQVLTLNCPFNVKVKYTKSLQRGSIQSVIVYIIVIVKIGWYVNQRSILMLSTTVRTVGTQKLLNWFPSNWKDVGFVG